jgi:hypothetical protein
VKILKNLGASLRSAAFGWHRQPLFLSCPCGCGDENRSAGARTRMRTPAHARARPCAERDCNSLRLDVLDFESDPFPNLLWTSTTEKTRGQGRACRLGIVEPKKGQSDDLETVRRIRWK